MAAIRKIIGGLFFLAFVAFNAIAIWRLEEFGPDLEEVGSTTPSMLVRLVQAVDLTPEQVFRPARLSADEIALHVKACVGDGRKGAELCKCLVNVIEDRTTGMQLQLAMLALQRRSGEDSLTKLPQLGAYSRAAAVHGMGFEAFKQDVLATKGAMKAARQQCSHKG